MILSTAFSMLRQLMLTQLMETVVLKETETLKLERKRFLLRFPSSPP
jgi:hypothetical protein